ncbi:unnamed protein product, partial [Allacma fusca]
MSMELNSVKNILSEGISVNNVVRIESSGGIAAGTTPQIVDDERNTTKMLTEIWSEIHSIKGELSERKDAEANNFTSLESNGTQFTL